MPSVEVRDAIHGLIQLSPEEWRVVDTPPFQRLRQISQLAMTHLIYPGARHSRFEHCMGVCSVAGRLVTRLNNAGAQLPEHNLRLAALLHDVGHGPFSHVSEEVMAAASKKSHIHEKVSAAIVRHHPDIRAAISSDEQREWIAELLEGSGHGSRRSAERDIVAGPADVDKLDYLLRDSHYCGVNYGRYDIDRVIDSARILRYDYAGGTELAFDHTGMYALEEMLLARYHMHRQVYGHKTRIATDRMVVRAMNLALEEEILPTDVFVVPEDMSTEFVEQYTQWDDRRVIQTILDTTGSKAAEVAKALSSRRLFKRVLNVTNDDLANRFDPSFAAKFLGKSEPTVIDASVPNIESSIAASIGIKPHWVSLHWDTKTSPIALPGQTILTDKDIMIQFPNTSPKPFHDVSEVFSRDQKAPAASINVYVATDQLDQSASHISETARPGLYDALEAVARSLAAV